MVWNLERSKSAYHSSFNPISAALDSATSEITTAFLRGTSKVSLGVRNRFKDVCETPVKVLQKNTPIIISHWRRIIG
ncbi:hypothetical protein JCM19301_3398 [Jejuia pallidilutea]|uniref:Uncharacterized protein n=1 Tax=Jejuia pallidilutea TaxID=504487 RepID=A0A090VNV9_9FLAO|nr:hypothetical protein JCM19301_3398 [Jejuia pallidilutea]GAL72388.1 hypothetical protein JCM19302_1150 [Jejuia pallidilutea]